MVNSDYDTLRRDMGLGQAHNCLTEYTTNDPPATSRFDMLREPLGHDIPVLSDQLSHLLDHCNNSCILTSKTVVGVLEGTVDHKVFMFNPQVWKHMKKSTTTIIFSLLRDQEIYPNIKGGVANLISAIRDDSIRLILVLNTPSTNIVHNHIPFELYAQVLLIRLPLHGIAPARLYRQLSAHSHVDCRNNGPLKEYVKCFKTLKGDQGKRIFLLLVIMHTIQADDCRCVACSVRYTFMDLLSLEIQGYVNVIISSTARKLLMYNNRSIADYLTIASAIRVKPLFDLPLSDYFYN